MAASEAKAVGHGGVTLVHRASGLSRKAILKGIREIDAGIPLAPDRIRRPGAGRKPITVTDPGLVDARAIAQTLRKRHHPVSHVKVAQLLHDLDYSLQSNRKTEEGRDHPDRDAQFQYISAAVTRCLAEHVPVISVDTKHKELIGHDLNTGQQWRPTKHPRHVQGHDFLTPAVPRAYPFGIYDIGRNRGFVNVGTDHDTGEFAVASIRVAA